MMIINHKMAQRNLGLLFMLKTGFIKCKILAVCPSKDDLEILLEEEVKTPRYVWDDKVVIDVYLESTSNELFKYQIWISRNEIKGKLGNMYINCVGSTQWAESEDQLWDSMKFYEDVEWEDGKIKSKKNVGEKTYHIARRGEPELLSMLKVGTLFFPKKVGETLFVDWDLLMDGEFHELQEKKFVDMVALVYVDNDMNQRVWKEFLPASFMKGITGGLEFDRYEFPRWKKFIDGLAYLEGGYTLTRLVDWDDKYFQTKKDISDDGDDY